MERLRIKTFDELTTRELYRLVQAREAVFVVEQQCPYPELDGKDQAAVHVWLEEGDTVLAYLRVLPAGVSFPEASIGRVISTRRGAGYGRRIVEAGLQVLEERWGGVPVRIEAQSYAQGFYARFGFRRVSEEFLEDGIPHVEMLRPGTKPQNA